MSEQQEEPIAEAKPAIKLPLIKRLIMGARNLTSGGPATIAAVAVLGLLILVGIGAFMGGTMVATKSNQSSVLLLTAQVKAAREESAKLSHENDKLRSELSDARAKIDAQTADLKVLKDEAETLRIQKAALDKLLIEVQDSIKGVKTAPPPPPDGAKIKFSNSECDVKGGVVKNKGDVACLNLKDAIEAMNGKPAAKPAEAKPSKPSKPAEHGEKKH